MAQRRVARAARPEEPQGGGRDRNRFLAAVTAAVVLVLAGTAEERTLGTVSDEQQMLYSAVSLATFGEIGIGRGQIFGVPRPGGDAVSPYGMGLSLLEVPAALAARPFESLFGEHASQTLFVFLQILLVAGAAALAGLLARGLGAGRYGEGLAVVGTALGSPLWAYVACGFSEPLQALCFAGGAAAAVGASARAAAGDSRGARRLAAAAGFFAGFALLTKGVNLVFAGLLAAPVLFDAAGRIALRRRGPLLAAAALGGAPPALAWLGFEIARFGRPFSSYASQEFTHSVADGLWRLLLGPNKGLLFYFPLLPLSVLGFVWLARAKESRPAALAIGGTAAGVWALYAGWWAWDGSHGWGPRFLVPVLPLLAAAAGAAAERSRISRRIAGALALLGVLVNLLGALQSEAASTHYVASTGGVRVSREEFESFPAAFREATGQKEEVLPRNQVARYDASFAPIPLHAFLLRQRLAAADAADLARRLSEAPWLATHPDARPRISPGAAVLTTTTPLANYLVAPFRWPHLGAALARRDGEPPGTFNNAWRNGVADQVFRNLDLGKPERAVPLAAFLHEQLPSGYSAAIYAECLRLSGRRDEAQGFLRGLPERAQLSPAVNVELALVARDAGAEDAARAFLSEAAKRLRTPAIERALGAAPSEWPRTLRLFLTTVPGAGTGPGPDGSGSGKMPPS